MEELLHQLQHSAFADFLGRQDHLFGAGAQLLHIAGIVLVLAPILLISLRLLGVGLVTQTPAQLARATAPYIWIGLLLLLVSGIAIFLPIASHYYPNPVFRFKFALLAAALLFHFTWYRHVVHGAGQRLFVNRTTAIIALTCWFGVAYAGRFIGFY